jgi:hypothetical protein
MTWVARVMQLSLRSLAPTSGSDAGCRACDKQTQAKHSLEWQPDLDKARTPLRSTMVQGGSQRSAQLYRLSCHIAASAQHRVPDGTWQLVAHSEEYLQQ